MYKRICKTTKDLEDSVSLLGACQTGKSTILREEFSQSVF